MRYVILLLTVLVLSSCGKEQCVSCLTEKGETVICEKGIKAKKLSTDPSINPCLRK